MDRGAELRFQGQSQSLAGERWRPAAIIHELHLPPLGPGALLVWELLFQPPLSSTTVPPAPLGEPEQHSGSATDWERQVMVCWERSRSGGLSILKGLQSPAGSSSGNCC